MPESLTAVENYLFDEADLNRVGACHDPENAKSGRVTQKAGMQYEGTRRKAIKSNQGITDVAMYAILKTDRK
jgi:ribosomal-protein-alanine N-acetyltransferase